MPRRPFAVLFVFAAACASAPGPIPDLANDLFLPELRVRSREHWQQQRRPELMRRFEHHVYGRPPDDLGRRIVTITATKPDALDGLATRYQLRVSLRRHPDWQGIDVMLFVPNDAAGPVPCFVGLNFRGNHTVTDAIDVPVVTEHARGDRASRWPLRRIVQGGVAIATAWYGDIEPDRADGWREGLRGVVAGREHEWLDGEWGAIGAWAFGLSCMADAAESVASIDTSRLAVMGHSRLGKTALWAGARDSRFVVVVSNNSGEGGAALMRHPVGETTAVITAHFPHWFTRTYRRYAADPASCPVDQHMLLALLAPRAAYVASAVEDTWADPEGEFLSARHAGPAWQAFGLAGVGVEAMPAVDTPVGDHVGYHVRSGGHDVTDYDWQRYLDFARRHWRR